MVHLPSATIRRERCICNIEVVDEFFNIEVVDEVFVFAALRHPGFSFDLPLNIKVDAEFYNIEVVD